MKKKIILSVCVVMAMVFSLPSHAQRLMPKQKGTEVMGNVPFIKGGKFFGKDNFDPGISLIRCLKRENYSSVGVKYEQQNMPYRDYSVKPKDALLQMGCMHPILSDRGRNVLLYGGISTLGGYEQLDENKKLLPDGATLLGRSCSVYGGAIYGSAEVFLTDGLLFLVKTQGWLFFGSDVHHFRSMLSAGLRFSS